MDNHNHSHALLELVTQQMTAAVTRCSRDLRYLWANQRYADWLRRPIDTIVGRPIIDVLGKEAFENLRPHFDRVLSGAKVSYEEDVNFHGIGRRWISATYTPTLDAAGVADGWVAVVLDVTERKQVEEALREGKARLGAEAGALAALDDLSSHLWQMSSLQDGLSEMLAAVMALMGANKANVQLLDEQRGVLSIAAQYGFEQPFLDFFREVSIADQSACGRALSSGKRVVIEDTETDVPFAALRPIARASGFRAVISTPMVSREGRVLGILSTHFASPHRPTDESLRRLDLYVRQASGFVERCTAERVVKEAETRFRLVADTAPVLIWMTGTDKLCTYFNEPWLEFTGRSIEQELGNGWAEGVHPDDLRNCLQTYTQSFEHRERFEMEYRLRRRDGEYRWIFDIGVPRYGQDGSFVGYIGSCVDVTDRKAADEARFRHAAVVESSEDAIISKNPDAVIVSWNAGAQRLFGYTEAEAIGQPITILIPPELRDEENQILKRLKAGGRIEHYETKRLTKNGKKVDVSLTIGPIRDSSGKVVGFSKIAHDITQRKRTEESVKESELRFRLVADTAPVLIWMSGTNKLCTYFNKPWLEFTGRSIDQEIGTGWAEGVHPEDLKRCLETYTHCFERREKFTMDYRLRRHDGEYRSVHDIGVPRFNPDGTFAGYIGSCTDITDHKLSEEAISNVNRRLLQAQEQERTRIARELHDNIGQRLALLAIEIDRLKGSCNSKVRAGMCELKKEINELSTDVHAISHDLHSAKLEHLGLVATARSLCKEFGEHQNLQINFKSHDLPDSFPPDVSLCLIRVLQEGLHNAAKHSGVRHIEVQLRGTSEELQLIIRDLGRGFDIKEATRSRGLGLTSMQERVRLVNGNLAIDSQPMAGTTINVRVPLNPEHAPQRALLA